MTKPKICSGMSVSESPELARSPRASGCLDVNLAMGDRKKGIITVSEDFVKLHEQPSVSPKPVIGWAAKTSLSGLNCKSSKVIPWSSKAICSSLTVFRQKTTR